MFNRTFPLVFIAILLLCLCFPIARTQGLLNPSEMTVATIQGGNPATLDPAIAYDTASGEPIQNVYETLVFFDREKIDQFVPMLATNWTISSDGLSYTFKIRGTDGTEPPVKFHNGHTLTTEDVEYSLKRVMVYERGPAWMFYEPLLNRTSSRDETGNIVVTAEQIDNAITTTATTVTFHLAIPYPPFLQILSQTWASILCKDWCAALGDWPGTWDNWQNYDGASPSVIELQNTDAPGPHLNAMCGTGPYYLEYLDNDLQEWSIRKFDGCWRGWPAPGSKGFLESVKETWRYTWQERRDMFLAGQVDVLAVPRTNVTEVLGQTGVRCIYPLPQLSCDAMFFTFNISESSPYMGVPSGLPRGVLDESGIPPNLFTDIDVRKGFAYAMNYTELIDDCFAGEAYQPATPIIWGVPFYNPSQEKYGIELTKAEQHFRAAWNGQLWANGFNMTLCYSEGSFLRQRLCEIIKSNVEGLNPKFHINVISLPWSEYQPQRDSHEMVLFLLGWLADFSDPHNFAYAFMYSQGFFALRQGYKNATIDALAEAGMRQTNVDQRRQIYYELQSVYHEDCPSVPLDQARGRFFERDWVQGWYFNPLYPGNYYYALWKEEIPPAQVTPGSNVVDAVQASDTKVLINTTGSGSVSVSRNDINVEGTVPESIVSIMCVTVDTTVPHSEIVFPIEIRMYCKSQQIISAYVDQSTLRMYYWNETSQEWALEANTGWVTPSDVSPDIYSGYVWAKIYHLSLFAAMGKLKSAPPNAAVGGEWVPTDKLQLLAPWINLISLMTILTTSYVYVRRKRRQN